jgi:hypothetical protein
MRVDQRPIIPSGDRTAPIEGVKPVVSRQATKSFEAVLSKREIRARRAQRGDVEQLNSTTDINAELFGSTRSLEILEYVLDSIVPSLDAEPEIKSLAEELIREEIDMRRALEQQRSEVLA